LGNKLSNISFSVENITGRISSTAAVLYTIIHYNITVITNNDKYEQHHNKLYAPKAAAAAAT